MRMSSGVARKRSSRSIYEEAEKKSFLVFKYPLIVFIVSVDCVYGLGLAYTVIFRIIPGKGEPNEWYKLYKLR